MINNKNKILAIIPARSGSKGLPNKNTSIIFNRPLIYYSIKAAQESKFINEIVVSSDSQNILDIALSFKSSIIERPKEIAGDSSSIDSVITHVLESQKFSHNDYELIVLLQPTSPLRTSRHLDEAFDSFFNNNCNSLISVYNPDKTPLKSFIKNSDGYLSGIVNDKYPFMNRQELPNVFMPNGAIYIFKSLEFMKKKMITLNSTIPFLMERKESFDIDSKDDLAKAEKYMIQNREIYE